jgi:hypothetical protein
MNRDNARIPVLGVIQDKKIPNPFGFQDFPETHPGIESDPDDGPRRAVSAGAAQRDHLTASNVGLPCILYD